MIPDLLAVVRAAQAILLGVEQPIDLNYVAILKSDWEAVQASVAAFEEGG